MALTKNIRHYFAMYMSVLTDYETPEQTGRFICFVRVAFDRLRRLAFSFELV